MEYSFVPSDLSSQTELSDVEIKETDQYLH